MGHPFSSVHSTDPQYEPCSPVKSTGQDVDIFQLLEGTDVTNASQYACCDVTWNEEHLRVVNGINFLATCKNVDCPLFLKGVVSPMGTYGHRKGLCTIDREMQGITCPRCKKLIQPDSSLGIGICNCKFEVRFKMKNEKERMIKCATQTNQLVLVKCFKLSSQKFDFLEIQIS